MIGIGLLLAKIYFFEKNLTSNPNEKRPSTIISTAKELVSSDKKALRGETKERINILLLGMGGEGHKGEYLTDTIILASINPKTYETALISIPRDLYVEIPDTHVFTKINAVYAYGKKNLEKNNLSTIEPIKKVVENITGQSIDYYLTINFDGFKQVIDELGGIIVQVENDLIDTRYPGPGNSYETFEIKQGTHLINGDVALKYARVRHVAGGDFGRLKRQQDIISAVKRRALSIENFINPVKFTNLLDITGKNIQTNIQLDEIPAFIDIIKNINTYQMNAKVLDAWSPDSLLAVSHVLLGNVNAFILVPRTGNYKEIQNLTANIFDLEKIEKIKKEIEQEQAKIVLISEDYKNENRLKTFFQKMNYSVEFIKDPVFSEKCRDKIQIFASANNKFYTLSDLATKFDSEVQTLSSLDFPADIALCFPAKELEKIEEQVTQNNADDFESGLILDDNGNILYNEY